MAKIEGFKLQNYRVLKDISFGKLWNHQQNSPLTPLVAVIGKNGTGKSTLFDAFGFLADAFTVGVEEACDLKQRGGFNKLRSAGTSGPMRFEIYYKETPNERPITYEVAIALDEQGRPYVQEERLRQRRKGETSGRPLSFLYLKEGKGFAWIGEESYAKEQEETDLDVLVRDLKDEQPERIKVELTDKRLLGIATLGVLKEHPRITRFRNFLGGWYLCYFAPDAARSLPLAGPQKHLNIHGDNLGNVVQYLEREYRDKFQSILKRIAGKIPGIHRIDTKRTDDGRLLLRFNDRGFKDPFYAQQMSDGTLKIFAYMLLLEDPQPPPFLCIEEPENGLYHKLLETLAKEFREHATGKKNEPQIFITTHSPYFVDALSPNETWFLQKGKDGFSTIHHACDDLVVKGMVDEGLPLGSLWYSDYLDAR